MWLGSNSCAPKGVPSLVGESNTFRVIFMRDSFLDPFGLDYSLPLEKEYTSFSRESADHSVLI